MIRNVVVGKLEPGLELSAIEPGLTAILALEIPGRVACAVGTDLRLREETWDYAITADFVDEESYHAYDADPEHTRVRAELIGPYSEEIVRIQFLLG